MNRVFCCGAAVVVVACVFAGCTRAPTMTIAAPAKVQRALDVVSDIECNAVLVDKDGDRGDVVGLDRGDDGVSFSGFLEADPGTYTLELTFTGVVVAAPDARHFLGRLTSDSFAVVEGSTSTPDFSTGLDTVGDDGEGDEDGDGLGFLDEVIVGSDVDDADSDDDGVNDGADCAPVSAGDSFVIAAGGSIDDCDGDGFASVDAVFADDGGDCADEDAAVHPGVDDDCGSVLDQDCDPSTCPVNDADGPTIAIDAPRADQTRGCGLQVTATVRDPSDVTSVFATFVDDPFPTAQRQLGLLQQDDGDVWMSSPIGTIAGQGFRDGGHELELRATDGAGNQSSVGVSFDLDTALPTSTITGPSVIDQTAATLTFSATAPAAITRFTVFAAPASTTSTTTFDLTQARVLQELPAAGGTVDVDAADFDARSAVYAVVEDAEGRVLSPFISNQASVSGGGFFVLACDGSFDKVAPAVVVEPAPAAGDLVPMTGKLQDAIDRATAIDPQARLAAVFGLGVDADGAVDLEDGANFSYRWEYRFLRADSSGITVRWLTPAFGNNRPTVEEVADPLDDEALVADVADLADSDAAVAVYNASGCGTFSGNDNDTALLQHAGGVDRWFLQASGGGSLGLNAVTLAEVFRSCD